MIETFLTYICEHAHHAPWIIFSLLLLSGINIPISEDMMLLGGGAIAATCFQDHVLQLYFWIFLGCYLSAWEGYWIGRLLGPKLYQISLFKKIITPERMDWLRSYYAKYGIFTFIIVRFCPGGVRSALFMSSGLTKMPFPLFMMRDGLACLLSSSVIFSIGYHFAANIDKIFLYLKRYSLGFFTLFFIAITICLIYYGYHYYFKKESNNK
jgi:membrane protein DedA with SNARE-associated domain